MYIYCNKLQNDGDMSSEINEGSVYPFHIKVQINVECSLNEYVSLCKSWEIINTLLEGVDV